MTIFFFYYFRRFALYYTYYSIHKQTLEKSKKQQLKLTKLPKRKCQSNNECTNVFLACVHLQADSQALNILVFLAVNLEKSHLHLFVF